MKVFKEFHEKWAINEVTNETYICFVQVCSNCGSVEEEYRSLGKESLAFKIDFTKAYEHVDRAFWILCSKRKVLVIDGGCGYEVVCLSISFQL